MLERTIVNPIGQEHIWENILNKINNWKKMFHVSQVSRRPPYQVESTQTHSSRKYMSLIHYRFLASLQSMMVISLHWQVVTALCTCPKGNRGTHTIDKYAAYVSWILVSRYFIVFKYFILALELLGLRYFSIHEYMNAL
jgi:hypothetical protein